MSEPRNPSAKFWRETSALYRATSTTEKSYYPAIKELWGRLLESRNLPFEVRVETSEGSAATGTKLPDLALYDRGEFVSVLSEVKPPDVEIAKMATSVEHNNQVGRYLSRTGVMLLCNIRAVGLLACKPGYARQLNIPVPPDKRDLLETVNLWPSEDALRKGRPIDKDAEAELADLLERAVTEFAPIADPASLARILARQARRAKADLPEHFDSVSGLLDDYRVALGLSFDLETEKGAEFFRSSLVQTAYYGLFAGWTLWHRAQDGTAFRWEQMDSYLKIPFLGKLFYEFKHPDRLAELRLGEHLDRADATLGRVDRGTFFGRFSYSTLRPTDGADEQPTAALTYFYEPFLEAFDPDLRKELGVWYTPTEIVRYQVRKVDHLLRTELGCARGFADPRVVVLDPCCGTAAYLLEVARCIAEDVRTRGDDAMLAAELLDALSTRVLGFEVLTAPFVVAQLQLYHALTEVGARPSPGQRPAVFLTNALSGWDGPDQIKVNFPELRQEHEAARRVKRDAKIIVMLGNPPYNRFAGTALDEEADLVDHFKGIRRREKKVKGKMVMVQEGESLLYTRWGIRKQLLDDLYIRFFRLAEKRIGEKAEYGVVSYISNSSYLTGRSHPLMRESLLRNFNEIWIDNTNGDKYKTGKIVPLGMPGAGTADQSMFTTEQDRGGIQVGTCITTLLKRKKPATAPGATTRIHYRDFWGKADLKRRALIESLEMNRWDETTKTKVAQQPAGPRDYETFVPTESARWMFSARDANAGFESWPALDELFPTSYQGINPNRGLDGSVIDTDRESLTGRMRRYFAGKEFAELRSRYPELTEPRARYEPEQVWRSVKGHGFADQNIVPYLVFPLDQRWLYYEEARHFLNEPRRELGRNRTDNEFLLAVPQPRRGSETRPLLTRALFDLHVHDRGSIGFPRESRAGELLELAANLNGDAWKALRAAWGLRGELSDDPARRLVADLFRAALAIMHSPQYENDHADALAQDWAHLPVPKDRTLFAELVALGKRLGVLLDAAVSSDHVVTEILGKGAATVGPSVKHGGGQVAQQDLTVSVAYFGAARGKWIERAYAERELQHPAWGDTTGDLYINDQVYFMNVPKAVWSYEIGGYPVLKKWLGYRQANRRTGQPLTLAERHHFRSMIQRIAALIALHGETDTLYERSAAAAFTAEELGVRK